MLSPLRLLAALLLLAWFARHRLPRRARAVAYVLAAVLVVLTTPLGANALLGWQESRAPLAAQCSAPLPDTIVLLSAGLDRHPRSEEDAAALDVAGVRRLLAAMELYRRTPGARLVILGSSGYMIADSRILADLAQRLGAEADAIRIETRSLTTWENAQAAARLAPRLPRRIWLVTSAVHMARAFDTFSRAGFAPCAWAAAPDYHAADGPGYFLPGGSAVLKSEQALHEIVGALVYRLRRAPAPMPAPRQ